MNLFWKTISYSFGYIVIVYQISSYTIYFHIITLDFILNVIVIYFINQVRFAHYLFQTWVQRGRNSVWFNLAHEKLRDEKRADGHGRDVISTVQRRKFSCCRTKSLAVDRNNYRAVLLSCELLSTVTDVRYNSSAHHYTVRREYFLYVYEFFIEHTNTGHDISLVNWLGLLDSPLRDSIKYFFCVF